MNRNLKGCFAENLSVCYLQEMGYHVFKGNQTNSPVDLIALDPKTLKVRLFDIKTRNYRKDGSKIARNARNPLVELLYVDINKKECHISQKRVK
jgi:Holliday junction resolvase-like predicted endonuclease|tara:strand:- start:1557 stop:1838 length:282 start_codon:yes stop_codon:yes gene_type:complete